MNKTSKHYTPTTKCGGAILDSLCRVGRSVWRSVRPSVIKIWCPLNKFWKTASIQFKFGLLINNVKTQVKFDLGYNPLIFDGVMGLLKKQHKNWCPLNNFWKTASFQFKFGMLINNVKTQAKFDLGYNPLIFDGVMGLL